METAERWDRRASRGSPPVILQLLMRALFMTFVVCCLGSASLQILAWTRHARDGVPVSFRTLWKPEEHFDAIGTRQIILARRLLTVGGVAYLTFGFLLLVTSILPNAS